MEPVDIVLTKETFEVLASGTRLTILKNLNERRMTVTELADDLGLAKSTVHHHLQRLADAGLVAAGEDGHAWVYYALTPEGQALLQPHGSARIRIILTAGLASLAGGGSLPVPEGPPLELLVAGIVLAVIGVILIVYACARRRGASPRTRGSRDIYR
jgi:DNA-binding transcriptional ArsR family regulator